jgi:antitoxin MazE
MPNDTWVSKRGNGLVVRIPRRIAKDAGLAEGDRLTMEVETANTIVLRPAHRKYELRQLVSGITARNRHSEADWGPPAGQELW